MRGTGRKPAQTGCESCGKSEVPFLPLLRRCAEVTRHKAVHPVQAPFFDGMASTESWGACSRAQIQSAGSEKGGGMDGEQGQGGRCREPGALGAVAGHEAGGGARASTRVRGVEEAESTPESRQGTRFRAGAEVVTEAGSGGVGSGAGVAGRAGPEASSRRLWRPQSSLGLRLRGVALAVAVAVAHWGLAVGAPFQFTDAYRARCPRLTDPPPKGFQLWSEPATWPNRVVPGVGKAVGANVTIGCNKAVLLDVPAVRLTVLQIQGMLKVLDPLPPQKPAKYSVQACFVLVEGQLHIGSDAQHLRSKVTFTLLPNPWKRQTWRASFNPPADPQNPRELGHKAFAVMGGYVDLHGMPGGGGTPSWVRLAATARAGQGYIVVDEDVSQTWPVGARIALTSTGFQSDQAEERTIRKLKKHPRGTTIALDEPLEFMHWGDAKGIPDGAGGYVDERAEVALLSRNIVITGLDEPPPYQYEGGHFIVFMTPTPQHIEGVEYHLMGQQGNLGRYNIHIHVCGDVRNKFVVRKNSIHDSKQRCVVVHATHNLTVDSNVAYNTSGHCFMIEEGGEQDNTFIHNLGFLTRPVDRLIYLDASKRVSEETDTLPSTFWITNMKNRWIGNVAGGSADSGYWTELRKFVRGMSQYLPSLASINPSASYLLEFRDNVAHSNDGFGVRLYPKGVQARMNFDYSDYTTKNTNLWPARNTTVSGLVVYKHKNTGFFMHLSANVYVVDSTFADNWVGVSLSGSDKGGVVNCRFVGQSNNMDTIFQKYCNNFRGIRYCQPIRGCKWDGNNMRNMRETGGRYWRAPRFGIQVAQWGMGWGGEVVFKIKDNSFVNYDASCGRLWAAVGLGWPSAAAQTGGTLQWWNTNQYLQGMKLGRGVNPVQFVPEVYTQPNSTYIIAPGEFVTDIAVRDVDGSVVGGRGGMLVGASPSLRPLRGTKCKALGPAMRGLACRGACYRTIWVTYIEEGYKFKDKPTPRPRGSFSWLSIKRLEDGVERTTDGNLNDLAPVGSVLSYRNYVFSLHAAPGITYVLTIHPPTAKPAWRPDNVTIAYRDNGACGEGVTFLLPSMQQATWTFPLDKEKFWSPCPGSQSRLLEYSWQCYNNAAALRVRLDGANPDSNQVFLLTAPAASTACASTTRCGVYTNADVYWYDTTGGELHAPVPGAMGFNMPLYPATGWRRGLGIIGYAGFAWNSILSHTPPPGMKRVTYYYRKTFKVVHSACYQGLFLDFFPTQGLAVYLNGVEIFRFNLPDGPLLTGTFAVKQYWWNTPGAFNSTYIDLRRSRAALVEGTNFLAFETHLAGTWQTYSYFDTRLSLDMTSPRCKAVNKRTEVCDGLDNNGDGRVDVDPRTGRLFKRPCSTACGSGVETCYLGAYQGCNARTPKAEVCNGKDDNCDGLVDNGRAQSRLGCPGRHTCFKGKCLRVTAFSTSYPVIQRSAGKWLFWPKGSPTADSPTWFSGNPGALVKKFKAGSTPFGAKGSPGGPFATTLPVLGSDVSQYYFLRSFFLTASQAKETRSLTLRFQANAGLLVWSNGRVLARSNLLSWFDPSNSQQVNLPATSPISDEDASAWSTSEPGSNSSFRTGAVKAGTNWVAALLAIGAMKATAASFNLELLRNVITPCSSLPGRPSACVRWGPVTSLIELDDTWKYLDASRPLPKDNWYTPRFNDASWPQANATIGNQKWYTSVISMDRSRISYYFRRTISVRDGSCYVSLRLGLKALDGAVIYINGAEVLRWQFDSTIGEVTPTTFSSTGWPAASKANFTLSGQWLRNGLNVIAAELHLSAQATNTWLFGLSLSGQREMYACQPSPLL